jgi:hypothetical protein
MSLGWRKDDAGGKKKMSHVQSIVINTSNSMMEKVINYCFEEGF